MARGGLRVGERLVGRVAGTPAVESLDYRGEECKRGEDAAWMDDGVVRHVVEDAAEDVVILEFEERAVFLFVESDESV